MSGFPQNMQIDVATVGIILLQIIYTYLNTTPREAHKFELFVVCMKGFA